MRAAVPATTLAKSGFAAATLSDGGVYKEKPDVAIVVFGEAPYAEFQGDVATLDYQPSEATDLLDRKAAPLGRLARGQPFFLDQRLERLPSAKLESSNPFVTLCDGGDDDDAELAVE